MTQVRRGRIIDAVLRGLAPLAMLSPELRARADELRARLDAQPRIVIVGRIKSGKSTLLNAFVGAPVAETAALEATNVVTVYQYGAPDRAEAVLKDGRRIPITTRRGEVTNLPVPAVEIAYVNRWMPIAAIKDYSLIDTPGLATLTSANEAATRSALLEGYEQTRQASVDADAALFLFDAVPREDEVQFISQLGFTSLNTLGLLSRADSFEDGPLGEVDPIEAAREHAGVLQKRLHGYIDKVYPVAGLLAQTARTGTITENFARQLAIQAEKSDVEILEAVLGPDEDAAMQVGYLVDTVGEYGLFRGREHAAEGAAALTDWLLERSGVIELQRFISTDIARFAVLHRSASVLRDIGRLAFEFPQYQQEIRRSFSYLNSAPELLDVALMSSLKSLVHAGSTGPMKDEITQLLIGERPADRLGLPPEASPWDLINTIREKRSNLHAMGLSLLDPAEEEALIVIDRAYNELESYAQSLT
ncbi:Isoniazid-induced protein IniC [Corynebacterium aquatimens]|nr:Isoniazid-induced protein IniC [Corynebacterium aquatimens]